MVPWGEKKLFLSFSPCLRLCLQHVQKTNGFRMSVSVRWPAHSHCGRHDESRLFQLPTKDSTQALVKSKSCRQVDVSPPSSDSINGASLPPREGLSRKQTAVFVHALLQMLRNDLGGPREAPGCTVNRTWHILLYCNAQRWMGRRVTCVPSLPYSVLFCVAIQSCCVMVTVWVMRTHSAGVVQSFSFCFSHLSFLFVFFFFSTQPSFLYFKH